MKLRYCCQANSMVPRFFRLYAMKDVLTFRSYWLAKKVHHLDEDFGKSTDLFF